MLYYYNFVYYPAILNKEPLLIMKFPALSPWKLNAWPYYCNYAMIPLESQCFNKNRVSHWVYFQSSEREDQLYLCRYGRFYEGHRWFHTSLEEIL